MQKIFDVMNNLSISFRGLIFLMLFVSISCVKEEQKKKDSEEGEVKQKEYNNLEYGDKQINLAKIFDIEDDIKEGKIKGKVVYTSSNEDVVSIDDKGNVNIKKPGKTLVKAFENTSIKKSLKLLGIVSFDIKKRELDIVGLSNGLKKTYDGSIVPTPQGKPKLNNIVSGDDVSFADGYPKYSFKTKGAGIDKDIKVEAKLKGKDASFYNIKELTGLKQTIEAKQLTIKGLSNGDDRLYLGKDAPANPKGKALLYGIIPKDDVSFLDGYPKYSFGAKKIGKDLSINVDTKLKGEKASYYKVATPTNLKQSIELAVRFDASKGSVTGLLDKYKDATKIVIPEYIDGKKVERIAAEAFVSYIKPIKMEEFNLRRRYKIYW